jgi:hypothetical protein
MKRLHALGYFLKVLLIGVDRCECDGELKLWDYRKVVCKDCGARN